PESALLCEVIVPVPSLRAPFQTAVACRSMVVSCVWDQPPRRMSRPAINIGQENRPSEGLLADVDPGRACEFGHALGRYADGGIGRAGGGNDLVECLQRDVAMDRQRLRQAEGADPADRVA